MEFTDKQDKLIRSLAASYGMEYEDVKHAIENFNSKKVLLDMPIVQKQDIKPCTSPGKKKIIDKTEKSIAWKKRMNNLKNKL